MFCSRHLHVLARYGMITQPDSMLCEDALQGECQVPVVHNTIIQLYILFLLSMLLIGTITYRPTQFTPVAKYNKPQTKIRLFKFIQV